MVKREVGEKRRTEGKWIGTGYEGKGANREGWAVGDERLQARKSGLQNRRKRGDLAESCVQRVWLRVTTG